MLCASHDAAHDEDLRCQLCGRDERHHCALDECQKIFVVGFVFRLAGGSAFRHVSLLCKDNEHVSDTDTRAAMNMVRANPNRAPL